MRCNIVLHCGADVNRFQVPMICLALGFMKASHGHARSRIPVSADVTISMVQKSYNVLFLCTGNSARSILAECVLNRLGRGKFRAYSAGSHPKGEVHAYALDLLKGQNYDVSMLRSKSWNEFAVEGAPSLDFVFTVCGNAAEETCPVWPGQPISAHWGLPDPAAAQGSEAERRYAFAEAMAMLTQRIDIFCDLPIEAIDALGLKAQLDRIGALETETQPG